MRLLVVPMRVRGRARSQQEIQSTEPVAGDVVIGQNKSEVLGRFSNVASFHTSGAAEPQPLPPLHDVTLSWMGPLGMVLTGTELVDGTAYAQSWHCRVG